MVVFSPLEASSLRSSILAYVFIMFVYATGLWFFYGLVQVNNTTPCTYFLDPGNPGSLFCLRWSTDFPLFFIYFCQGYFCWVLFFNMWAIADYRSSLTNNIALFFDMLAIVLNAVTLIFLGFAWKNANLDGQPFNPANDPRYCCVYFGNPANFCPNNVACAPPVAPSDLRVSSDFLVFFWFTVGISGWHLLIVLINLVSGVNACTLLGRERAAGLDTRGVRYRPPVPVLGDVNEAAIAADFADDFGPNQHLHALTHDAVKKSKHYEDPHKNNGDWVNIWDQVNSDYYEMGYRNLYEENERDYSEKGANMASVAGARTGRKRRGTIRAEKNGTINFHLGV